MVIQMDGATELIVNLSFKKFKKLKIYIHYYYDGNRDEGKGYTYTLPYSCPSSYTHRDMSTSPLSYLILVVDIRPSVQQHLHNGEMPTLRGLGKGRPPILHHIDRHG